MADDRYRTRDYRAARKAADAAQGRGEWLTCRQPVCLMPSRDIGPDEPIDIAHDDSGTEVLGPAHARCNRSDGGKRRHQSPTHRWVL